MKSWLHPVRYVVALISLSAGLLLVTACGGPQVIEPPVLHLGEDICDDCGMIISDPRYAGSYLYETGEKRYKSLIFDDIGDMMGHIKDHPEHTIAGMWVHDFETEEWIDAESAFYVVSTEIPTPMGHGILAVSSEAQAQKIAADVNGVILDWGHARVEMALAGHH